MQNAILMPMFALAALTFCVLLMIPLRRIKAARAGQVGPGDFRYGESARVPPDVCLPNRNYMNLLELPVLFYVACLVLYASHSVSALQVQLAWAYVALRLVHSLIHLTYNNVLHRLAAFAASNAVLAVMWTLLGVAVAGLPNA